MAIVTAARKIQATVAYICDPKEGQFGPYQSVLFESPELTADRPGVKEAGKLWKSMPPRDAQQLSRGEVVYLNPTQRNGRDTWDIELTTVETMTTAQPHPATTAPPTGYQGMTAQLKRDCAEYVKEQAALFAFCRQEAIAAMPGAPDEAIQSAAASLFIATQRKFNLA